MSDPRSVLEGCRGSIKTSVGRGRKGPKKGKTSTEITILTTGGMQTHEKQLEGKPPGVLRAPSGEGEYLKILNFH